jgi:hypothetical protein
MDAQEKLARRAASKTEPKKHKLLILQSRYLLGLRSTGDWIDEMKDHHGEGDLLSGKRAMSPYIPAVVVDLNREEM